MALPVPNLDNRTFQDLVNEARRMIPVHCPEWTDHNLSDPGITLIELFAWMTELLIYRLNKVPDKNYVKFLELLGVSLAPAHAATADVTFRLSAPLADSVTIPMGTEVATVRTETQEAIIFTTDRDLSIAPPGLAYFFTGPGFDDRLPELNEQEATSVNESEGLALFLDVPQPDNTFYLGFTEDLRGTALAVSLEFGQLAPGINPANPPLSWEYWDASGGRWFAFERGPDAEAWLEADGTSGLNTTGQLTFHVPRAAGQTSVGLTEAFWIRCRVTPWTLEQGSYETSPRLKSVHAESIGGTVGASNVVRVSNELLGVSNGKAGQAMQVSKVPILALDSNETVQVQREDESGWEEWRLVDDFSSSGPEDKVFVCDPQAGEIVFGPVIRSPEGQEVRYGATPAPGSQTRLSSYRYGGGPKGNVGRETLTVVKSSIPYVASVTNRRPATGGVDPEGIENAKLRGPQTLRTRNRAVTEEDFEYLAMEASPSVRRAKCIQPRELGHNGGPLPGVTQILLVPALPRPKRRVDPEQLELSRDVLQQVTEYLNQRRLLTAAITVSRPDYHWVSVEARVKASQGADLDEVSEAVEDRLNTFIHPLYGGTDGDGWPFGRSLFASELYSQIQNVQNVEYVEELSVFSVDPSTGQADSAGQTLNVSRAGLLCSYSHSVTCV